MAQARPLGPRPVRPASPINPVAETPPLVIKKNPNKSPNGLLSPHAHNDDSAAPTSRSTTPRPPTPSRPRLGLVIGGGSSDTGDYYRGGPGNSSETSPPTGPPDEPTIRPLSLSTQVPARQGTTFDLVDIISALDKPSTSSTSAQESSTSGQWSDSVLDEVDRLGEGAGGAVHRVRDKRTGTVMARKSITTRGAPMKQLLRELSIISSTMHPNIIRFYGAYMSPSSSEVKILMEYCEGGSLEAVGKRIKERGGIVGEKIACRLAEGVLQGLAYLHSKKTIHRDIKPSNILLSKEGIVILCDFGVSGELVNSVAGTFTGTSFYMAPERISGSEYTIRSDVWSTGISLLELVQNRFPFPNDLPPIELMMHITSAEPPQLEDIPELKVEWSPNMKDFIKQTLTVSATTRPTPKDMLEHPWIVTVMKQEVHMARWIRQVWDWPKPPRRAKDSDTSLPEREESPPKSGGT